MKLWIIGCAALLLAGCRQPEPPPISGQRTQTPPEESGSVTLTAEAQGNAGLELQTIRSLPVRDSIVAPGQITVNEDRTWSVGALVDGRVASVATKVGDRVKKGDIMARIHSHDVHEARAAFRSAELELTRLQAAEVYARRLRDRARRLLELKAASQQEADAAEAELRNAQTAARNASVVLERERSHIVEFLDIAIEDNGSPEADFVPIRAPEDGLVIERLATTGSVVSTGNPMFRLTATGIVWMIANVNETDLGYLKPGQKAGVTVRAFPNESFPGRILRLGEQLDPTTRTLQVRVEVPNSGHRLRPEMYATATIDRATSREALLVPESAAQELNGGRAVFVQAQPGRFEPRTIAVARVTGGQMEVTNGLRAGEVVVVKGSFVLKSQLLKRATAD